MKLGTETGSLMNHLMSGSGPAPEVGMGCTVLHWTDRSPGTIVKVTKTQVHVRGCHAKRLDKNFQSETQVYEITENPDARVEVFRLTKRGWRNKAGNGLLIGHRENYYDYSF
jgi:hypothetical protein